jgi:hypothetical protein
MTTEEKALYAEEAFKGFLEKVGIPSLRIGQSPSGMDYSNVLKLNNVRRPDFFVTLPELGAIFVDVKSRRKVSFYGNSNAREKYFYMNREEITELSNLRDKLSFPVWVAFAAECDVFHKRNICFETVSIKVVDAYRRRLDERSEDIRIYRIPSELVTVQDNSKNLLFQVGENKVTDDLIKKYQDRYAALHRQTKEFINSVIRRERGAISNDITKLLMPELGEILLQVEIEHIIDLQKQKGEIVEESGKLKLRGEA